MRTLWTLIFICCFSGISGQISELKSTTIDNHAYRFSERNTEIFQNALNNLKPGEILEIPEGIFDVETLFVPVNRQNLTIKGKGPGKTILRRAGFQWDNNIQGDCPLRTEILVVSNSNNLTINGLTLEGNCHHIAVSGYGKWDYSTGKFIEGLPQFPTFTGSDLYQGSGGTVLYIRLSDNLTIHNVEVKNGFRWAIFLSRLNGLNFHHNIIDTGNLSTEFKGHFDPPPFNEVMHMHTSQDGLHLVNVSNAIIEYNDIHSEDSGIAIELNPRGSNFGYDICENIRINNNYVNTLSPTDPEKLLNDEDLIYGNGLANEWIGQSGVDMFY
ncbi:MAG: hypothetical protein IH594_13110, partial [Bacteroidales bacterium]|nr:hypothetical protein [Bacteroidales bacterium]